MKHSFLSPHKSPETKKAMSTSPKTLVTDTELIASLFQRQANCASPCRKQRVMFLKYSLVHTISASLAV